MCPVFPRMGFATADFCHQFFCAYIPRLSFLLMKCHSIHSGKARSKRVKARSFFRSEGLPVFQKNCLLLKFEKFAVNLRRKTIKSNLCDWVLKVVLHVSRSES